MVASHLEEQSSASALPGEDPGLLSRRAKAVLRAGATCGSVVVLIALLYAAAVRAFAGDSDGATVVLEGHALGSGHVLLHGWALSLDSFWTIDAPLYAVAERLTGMHWALLYLVPAVIAGLVIALSAVLARDGRKGWPGAVAIITVVVVIGLPSHALATFLLRGPLHVGTTLWCLAAFVCLRTGRFDRWWFVAVGLLATGALGDSQVIVLGMVPVFLGGLVMMRRRRRWQSGLTAVAAAAASAILAVALWTFAGWAGAYTVNSTHPRASAQQAWTNIGHIATWGAAMLGVGDGGLGAGGVRGFQVAHLVSLLVVVAGVVVAAFGLFRGVAFGRPPTTANAGDYRTEDLLVLAFALDLGMFVFLTANSDPGYMRYLTAAVIFSSILAGRLVGRFASAFVSNSERRGSRGLHLAGASASVVVALVAVGFVTSLRPHLPDRPFIQLGQFLEAHHLRTGIGDYWSASITTVATDGVVAIRPVITTPTGRIVRYQRQSNAAWYAGTRFEFLVYDTARPWGGIQATTAQVTFGPPSHTYAVGSYRVAVWDHSLAVSTVGFSPVPTPSRSAGGH